MKPYEVIVRMLTTNKKHHIRIKARSPFDAMKRIILQLLPYEVHSLEIL